MHVPPLLPQIEYERQLFNICQKGVGVNNDISELLNCGIDLNMYNKVIQLGDAVFSELYA